MLAKVDVLEQALVKVARKTNVARDLRMGRADRGSFVDLEAFLEWLWGGTGMKERYCRSVCMWLFGYLAGIELEHQITNAMEVDGKNLNLKTGVGFKFGGYKKTRFCCVKLGKWVGFLSFYRFRVWVMLLYGVMGYIREMLEWKKMLVVSAVCEVRSSDLQCQV